MAYAFRNFTSQGNASGGGLTVNAPASTANGDLIVVVAYLESDTNTWSSIGSGFTQAANQDYAGSYDLRIWWKIAASEPASWTWTPTTNGWRSVVVAGYTGATGSGAGRVDKTSVNAVQTEHAWIDCPTVTTTAASDLLVAWAGNFNGSTWSYTSGPASTERVDFGGVTIYDVLNQGLGATGASRITAGTQDYAGGHVAFFLNLASANIPPGLGPVVGESLSSSSGNLAAMMR